MIAALAALLLQATAPVVAAASVAATPPTPADTPAKSAAQSLVDLEQVYQQSCGDRAFGSYNDMCNTMRDQIRLYRREAAREARARAPAPKSGLALAAPRR